MRSTNIVVPARNEEHRIEPMLRDYVVIFAGQPVTITVVLNNCQDNTRTVVEEVARTSRVPITMVDIPDAIGKGGAILAGWNNAAQEILAFSDADGATPASEFARLLQVAEQHDGAIATRFHRRSVIHNRTSFIRTIMSNLFRHAARVLFGMPFSDTQCGAKAFKKEALQPILRHITSTDFSFDLELLWRLHLRHADIHEVPITWTDKEGSSTLGRPTTFLKEGLRMIRSLFFIRRRTKS